MVNEMKKVISIVGDHHAVGPRDLCGFPNRVFMELAERDPTTNWSVMGHGVLGGIKSVGGCASKAFVEMFSCEADSYTAIIWVGIGEIDVQVEDNGFVDLYALSARSYQAIAAQVADAYMGLTKTIKPKLVPAPEVIYKRTKPQVTKPKQKTTPSLGDTVVIMQPDRIRNKRSAHG